MRGALVRDFAEAIRQGGGEVRIVRSEGQVCSASDASLFELANSKVCVLLKGQSIPKEQRMLLKSIASIEILTLSEVAIDKALMEELAVVKPSQLEIHRCDVGPGSMKTLGNFHNLRTLSIVACTTHEDLFQYIANCAELEKLIVGPNSSGNREHDLRTLASNKDLLSLRVVGIRIVPGSFNYFADGPHLETLELIDCQIDESELPQIGHFSSLIKLAVTQSPLTSSAIIQIGRLRAIEMLDLSGCRLRPGDLKSLSDLSQLRKLVLASCGLDDQAVPYFAVYPELVYVDLSDNQFTHEAVARLKSHFGVATLLVD